MFKRLISYFNGRHTLLAFFFTISGTGLAWFHRLDMSYVALVTAIQGWVFAHSAKEDHFEDKKKDDQNKC